jgi:hypothetical protein
LKASREKAADKFGKDVFLKPAEGFQYSVDTFTSYLSAFSKQQTKTETSWYYELFSKYVLPEDEWDLKHIIHLYQICGRVFGGRTYWDQRLTREIEKEKYTLSCSCCLDLCRVLLPPTLTSIPEDTKLLTMGGNQIGWELHPAKKKIEKEKKIEKKKLKKKEIGPEKQNGEQRGASEDFFSRIVTTQTPLVNALFTPMGVKTFLGDGRHMLCPFVIPLNMNHRGQDATRTRSIMNTIRGDQAGYHLCDSYNFCPIRNEVGSEKYGGHLLDYTEVDGLPLIGQPSAHIPHIPPGDKSYFMLCHLNLMELLANQNPSSDSARLRCTRYGEFLKKEDKNQDDITANFVEFKLQLDEFFSHQIMQGEHFTTILYKLQKLLIATHTTINKRKLFPHTPTARTETGVEELPLVFHQTRILLQFHTGIRLGTIEGCHRLHTAVTALTGFPSKGLADLTNLSPEPQPIRSSLFFMRAPCTDSTPNADYAIGESKFSDEVRRQYIFETVKFRVRVVVGFPSTVKFRARVVRGFRSTEYQYHTPVLKTYSICLF